MTADPDRLPDAVMRALDRLADEDAAQVLNDARAAANARARALLEEALVTRLLERALPRAKAEPRAGTDDRSGSADDGGSEHALYLYGVIPAEPLPTSGARGVGPGNPIEFVSAGDLAAVVSRVPLSEFGDEHLKQNLEQMEWLERTARHHEAVLEGIREQSTIIPMRICTLFRSVPSVKEMLDRESDPLRRALERLAGRNEWGVKALLDVAEAERALSTPAAPSRPSAAAATGRGYLESKQAERRTANEVRSWVRDAVAEVHETLSAAAAAALRNPPQPRELTGYRDEMVLNGAYLVPDGEREQFSGLVAALDDRHRGRGLRLELTGPWPPYNFVPPLTAA